MSRYADNVANINYFNANENEIYNDGNKPNYLVYMVEYNKGSSLKDIVYSLHDHHPCDEGIIKLIFLQMFLAVYNYHTHDICHQNLRYRCIRFVNNNIFNLKIMEFGHRNYIHMQNNPERDLDPCLVSPEMLVTNAQEEKSSDIWNIGIIL